MEENEASIQTLQNQICSKNSDSEKIRLESETKLNEMQEKMQILEDHILTRKIGTENLEVHKAALESKAADLESANQRLSEQVKGFQTGL